MFPFRTLTLYQLKISFTDSRSNDFFEKGQQVIYSSSTLNHYEGIEICTFRDFNSGKIIVWHADEIALEKWNELFEVVLFPK
jgi:hypothetical protein